MEKGHEKKDYQSNDQVTAAMIKQKDNVKKEKLQIIDVSFDRKVKLIG